MKINIFSKKLLLDLKKIYKKKKNPLHEPLLDDSDKLSLLNCLNSTHISTASDFTQKFEKEICKYTKSKYAICTSSGTAAIHASLILSNVKQDDEVIIPTLNFVAAANAIKYCNAYPHFIDIDKSNLSINPIFLKKYLKKILIKKKFVSYNKATKRRVSALILPHLFGYAGDAKAILSILKKYNIKLIEDASEGLGVFFNKKHVGITGKFGILSFNGNKIITTGGGGAILTNSKIDATKATLLISTNKIPHKWKYDYHDIGYNYRMPGLNAALGLSQIKKINFLIKKKKKNYNTIKFLFYDNADIILKEIPKKTKSNYWLQNLIINDQMVFDINKIIKTLNLNGIHARQAWCLLHKLNHFKNCPKSDTTNSEDIFRRMISIPSSANL